MTTIHAQQYAILFDNQDTLTYDNRVLANNQDSINILHTGYTFLQPGGNTISLGGILQNDYIDGIYLFQHHERKIGLLPHFYAGLPHLGFFYSFGSHGLQNIHVDFQQSIKKKFDINLHYDGYILGENTAFMRNSGYKNNNIQLLMNYNGNRYKGLYYLNYYFGNRQINQGIQDLNLMESTPLQLLEVNNGTAFSKFGNVEAGTQHLFSLTKDSLVQHGFVYENQLSTDNRKYSEQDIALANYPVTYLDTANTYDSYQYGRIRNAFGYYFQSKRLKIAAKAFHQYWLYKNHSYRSDTSEVGLNADLAFNWAAFSLKSQLDMTFLGAVGEISSFSTLNWSSKKLDVGAKVDFENKYPPVFLRRYQGNNIKWSFSNIQLQQSLKVGGYLDWKAKIPFQIHVDWANLSNQYWLINNELRNDTLKNVSLLQLNIKTQFKVKTFHFDPYFGMNLTSKNFQFAPLLDARLSLYWNQKLFSTKKFDFLLGATVRYNSKYQLATYNNLVDLYAFNDANLFYQPILHLDAFFGFQIDNFRLFFRYENIDAFWNKRTNFTTLYYPIAPGVIHVGITWDFFN